MTTEEIELKIVRHKKRVERRAKYLATLTKEQRKARDKYVHWLRTWRINYKRLVVLITANKKFVREQGHNDLKALNAVRVTLERQRLEAHTMMLGRMAYKIAFVPPSEISAAALAA